MLLFSHTLKRYVWVLPATFFTAAIVSLLWIPQPALLPFPMNGFVGALETVLPVLISLPLSFLVYDKSSIELALVHGLDTLQLFFTHLLSALFWIQLSLGAVVLCYRTAPLTEDQLAQMTIPPLLPDTLRMHMFISIIVSVLFFASLVFFLRVALRNCYVPMVGVLLTFTLFYERSRSLRMRGLGALRGALFDPYISSYIIGDALPQQYGFGTLWSANRLLFFDISLILLFASALILRRERMHE